VLTATLSGLLVGVLAVATLHRQNDSSAAAQRQTLLVESATGSFSKNVESLSGNMSALKLYPQLADTINKSIEANRTAVTDALRTLTLAFTGDPTASAAVAKTATDWEAFLKFVASAPTGRFTPAELAEAARQYQALYGALVEDEEVLQQRATALSETGIADAQAAGSRATWLVTVLLGVGVLVSVWLGFRVAGRVRGAVQGVSHLAEGLAEGDLTRASGVDTLDEVGRMAAAMEGHRGHLPPGVHHPGRHRRRGHRDRRDLRDHRTDQRHPAHHRLRRGGTDRHHPGDEPHSVGGGRRCRQHRADDRRGVRRHPAHVGCGGRDPGRGGRPGLHGEPAADAGVPLPLLRSC
jgi:hypothetical protein